MSRRFPPGVMELACEILDNIVDASTEIPNPTTNCLWSIIEDLLLIALPTKNLNYPKLLRSSQAQCGRKKLMKNAGISLRHLEQIQKLAESG